MTSPHPARATALMALAGSEDDYGYDDDFHDECWNCGGDGFVSSCMSEYACLYPEDGCDLCTHRCEVCNEKPALAASTKDQTHDG